MKYKLLIVSVCIWSESLFAQQIILDKLEPKLKTKALKETARTQLLIDVAHAYLFVDFMKALEYAEEALVVAERNGDKKAWIRALTIKGKADLYLGNGAAARSACRTALTESLRLNDLQGQVRSRIGIIYIASVGAQLDTALSEVEIAVKIAQSIQDTEGLIELYYQKAFCLTINGDYENCIVSAEEAISLCTSTSSSLLPVIQALLGYARACIGNLDRARVDMENAMTTAKLAGNKYGLQCLTINMGTSYWYGSNMQKALEYYLNGRGIAEQMNDRWTLTASVAGIAKIYGILEDFSVSLKYANETVDLARKYGFTDLLLEGLSDLGYSARGADQSEDCLNAYLEMAQVADSLDNKTFQLEASISLANSYVHFGQPDLALPYAIRGVQQARDFEDASLMSRAFLVEGNAILGASDEALNKSGLLINKRLELALKDYEAVISNEPEFLDRMSYAAYQGISEVYEKQGKYEEALLYFKKAKSVHDSLLNEEKNEAISGLQIAYDTEKKEREILVLGKEKEDQLRKIQKQKSIVKGLIGVGTLLLIFMIIFLNQRNKIKKGKRRSDELLLNILPEEVAEELKAKGSADAQLIDHVTVLFTDFKGFTQLSEKLTPKQLVAEINECFSAFDHIMQKFGVEKIKTIGDSYMAAGGVPRANKTHAVDVVNAALEIQHFMMEHQRRKKAAGELYFEIRIGVHSGAVVAGIVGVKKFAYDIWGDAVNTASRMESSGEIGKINISLNTYNLIHEYFECTPRGLIAAKGKGEVEMYFVERKII